MQFESKKNSPINENKWQHFKYDETKRCELQQQQDKVWIRVDTRMRHASSTHSLPTVVLLFECTVSYVAGNLELIQAAHERIVEEKAEPKAFLCLFEGQSGY